MMGAMTTPTATGSGVGTALAIGSPADDPGLGTLAPTVTLPDVELVAEGTWNASTGPAPVDAAMLEAILAAAQDPDVDAAAIHFGHYDPRFPLLSDGEPAVGWVHPTRVEMRGGRRVLIGDLVDIPAQLAGVIPKAYRRRSVELAEGVRTSRGTHPYTLTGLALLGVQAPAVKGLADVVARYSAPTGGQPFAITVEGLRSDTPGASGPASPTMATSAGHDGPGTQPTTEGARPVAKLTDDQLR